MTTHTPPASLPVGHPIAKANAIIENVASELSRTPPLTHDCGDRSTCATCIEWLDRFLDPLGDDAYELLQGSANDRHAVARAAATERLEAVWQLAIDRTVG